MTVFQRKRGGERSDQMAIAECETRTGFEIAFKFNRQFFGIECQIGD